MSQKHILFSSMGGEWDEFAWGELNRMASGVICDNLCICIADFYSRNGKIIGHGYKLLDYKLSSCLFVGKDSDHVEFYVDGRNNLRSNQVHYDGTHRMLFRELKNIVSDVALQTFLNKIRIGMVTSKDITEYTSAIGKYFKGYSNMC